MFGPSKNSSLVTLQRSGLVLLALAGTALLPAPAWAQGEDEGPDVEAAPADDAPADEALEDEGLQGEGEPEDEGEPHRTPGAVGVTADVEVTETVEPAAATAPAEEDAVVQEEDNFFNGLFSSKMKLGWDGSAEIDIGYARYDYELESYKPERFYDFRGRFVVGPVLEYDFDEHHFFRLTGQVVAWVREQAQRYQVNADDVYAQAGRRKKWDVKVGRFESWSVYHKGLGFDIYTLDDTGALREPNFDTQLFGVDMYEVNAIYFREMAGKLALHVYPIDILGFELLGLYGSEQTTNHLGARAAANLDLEFLRVTAGAEYRTREPSEEVTTLDPSGVEIPCDRCSERALLGFGGGAIVSVGPVELAANGAKSRLDAYQPDGADDLAASNDTTTIGGYFQVDPGSLLFQRSLIVGIGANRTELLVDNGDFERHIQGAAYIAYPLGFNEAMVKLVLSRADLLIEDLDPATGVVTARSSDMMAGRVRIRCSF